MTRLSVPRVPRDPEALVLALIQLRLTVKRSDGGKYWITHGFDAALDSVFAAADLVDVDAP